MTPIPTVVLHDFPPNKLSLLQLEAIQHLTHAYRYLSECFVHLNSKIDLCANVDARSIILRAREDVFGDPRFFQGDLVNSLVKTVEQVVA